MDKSEIIQVLEEIALLLELKGENPFKCRAYKTAARTLETFTGDFHEIVRSGKLAELKGIGEALVEKISHLALQGSLPYYTELKSSFPAGLLDLLKIPGVGPRKARVLFMELKISCIEELECACGENRIAPLDGFGEKTQLKILQGIQMLRQYAGQYRIGDVYDEAQYVLQELRTCPHIIRVEVAGSLRRWKEVVKDLDFVASSNSRADVMNFFVSLPNVVQVVAHGDTKSSVRLQSGINADLRVVEDATFPYTLHHFTGSKDHNVAIRSRALKQGIKVSEWGLFRISKDHPEADGDLIPCSDEEDIFKVLGLHYIPPELREDMGEIQAAEVAAVPELVKFQELKGCFHNHTTYSDGVNTLEEMAEAAIGLGWEYLGIADHSKSSFQAHGLTENQVREQWKEIDALNEKWKRKGIRFQLLKGIECDILPDGSMDFDDRFLAEFDFVVGSVHSVFTKPEDEMTRRIIRAVENPHVDMLGHITGRLLLERNGYEVNIPEVIRAASRFRKIIEINANTFRLELDWRFWKMASELGVKTSINPDAHVIDGLLDVRFGIGIARKGWLTSSHVINTKPLEQVLDVFRPGCYQ